MVKWRSKKLGDLLTLGNGLVLLVLVNFISALFFFRVDLTEEKRYTIKPATREVLRQLEDVVYVEVYLEGDLNAEFRRLRNAVRETLEEFRIDSDNKVQFRFTNPKSALGQKAQSEFLQELASKGIQVLPVIENKDGERIEQMVVPGALVSYEGAEVGVMLFKDNIAQRSQEVITQSIEGIEYELASAIMTLNAKSHKRVGILTGHGELDSLQMASLESTLARQYDVKRINIREMEKIVGVDVLLVARPTQTFGETDKYKLDQYLMSGGNLLLFLDQVNASMDKASDDNNFTFPYETGLADQLFKYGVRVNPDLIQDRFCAPYPVVVSNVGDKPQIMQLEWPFFPLIYQHANHPISRNMDAALTRFISSVDTVKATGVKKTPLLFSSQYSRKLTAPVKVSVNDLRKNVNPELFNEGPIPVGWLLEGTFTSVFKNRFLPDGVSKDGYTADGTPARMIVVGDGDFVKNDINPRNGRPQQLGMDPVSGRVFSNEAIVMNMIAYLTDQDGLITARNKEVTTRPLDKKRIKEEKTYWQMLNMVIPIVIIVLFGMTRAWWRRKQYASFK